MRNCINLRGNRKKRQKCLCEDGQGEELGKLNKVNENLRVNVKIMSLGE